MKRPKLQIALDTLDLASALAPLQKAHPHVDIVEVGTVLCLSRGMEAVRVLRSLYPDKILLADMRIVEAGAILSRMAFAAGADRVTVFGGTSLTAVEAVIREARQYGGEVQIEIFDSWNRDTARAWSDLGVGQIIVHRSRDAEAGGGLGWTRGDFERVRELDALGFAVTVTGGIGHSDIARFAGMPVHGFIVGRAICEAADPEAAARAFQDAITAHYGPP